MTFNWAKLWAWFFLYSITALSGVVYCYSTAVLFQKIEGREPEIILIRLLYLLLLPALLPVLHVSYSIQQYCTPKVNNQSNTFLIVAIFVFLSIIGTGAWLDHLAIDRLLSAEYTECSQERKNGLRAVTRVYKKDLSQCR